MNAHPKHYDRVRKMAQELRRWGDPGLVEELAANCNGLDDLMTEAARLLLAEGWGSARHKIACDLDEDCTCKEKK